MPLQAYSAEDSSCRPALQPVDPPSDVVSQESETNATTNHRVDAIWRLPPEGAPHNPGSARSGRARTATYGQSPPTRLNTTGVCLLERSRLIGRHTPAAVL